MERPTKRARIQGPEGFQKSKQTSRYKPPESITKFVSAFDHAPSSPVVQPDFTRVRPQNPFVEAREPTAGSSKPSVTKPPSFAHALQAVKTRSVKARAFNEPQAGPSSSPRSPHGDKTTSRNAPMLKYLQAGPGKPSAFKKPPSFAQPHAATTDETPPPLRVLNPPVLLLPAQSTTAPSKTAGVGLRPLYPALDRPPVKPRSILKPPPIPTVQTNKPFVPLKSLAPPPPLLPHRPVSPQKLVKTILTTNIAQATDPTKEGTGAELLSLFLQQHGHNFMSRTDQELQRGVMVSPDKRSRSKDPRFLRGGLAERVQHRISCTMTDFVLWKRQTEHKIESGSRCGWDMQLRILRVLDVLKLPERSRSTTSPRSGLALCRLMRRHPLAGGDLTLGTYVVVFHFAPTNGGRSPVSSMEWFAEANDVMVWLPWQKVELVGVEGCAELLGMFRTLDALTPPHCLLVVSRFCIVAPKVVEAT